MLLAAEQYLYDRKAKKLALGAVLPSIFLLLFILCIVAL